MSDMTPPPVPPAPPAPPMPPMAPMAPPVGGRPGPANDTSKIMAALSLVIWPVALFAILAEPYKSEKFVKFHAMQGLAFGIAWWLIWWVLSQLVWMVWTLGLMLSSLVGLLGLLVGIYLIVMAVKVYNGSYVELPVVFGFVKGYIGE